MQLSVLRISLSTILFLTITLQSFAQDFVYYNFSVSEGLPSVETYDLFQDRSGFLWIGGDNGITKYDGREFINYNIRDGLSDPVVFGFSEDHKGRIWFRTFSGKISYFNDGKIYTYKYNEKLVGLINGTLNSLYCNKNEKLIFTSGRNFGSIDDNGVIQLKQVKRDYLEYQSAENAINTTAYFGPTNTIKKILIKGREFPIQLSDIVHNNYTIQNVWWNGILYISINTNIFAFNGSTITKVHTAKNQITNLTIDKNNNLWVGYRKGGVIRFMNNNFSDPFLVSFLNTKTVTKTLQDHEGGYWFSTLESGIFYVPYLSIRKFPLSLSEKTIKIIHAKQHFLIGDQAGNFSLFDPLTKKIRWTKSLPDPVVTMFTDKRNNYWISSSASVYTFDSTFRLIKKTKICALGIAQDSHGFIWAISSNKIVKFTEFGDSIFCKHEDAHYRSINIKDSLLYLTTTTEFQIRNFLLKKVILPDKFKGYKIRKLSPLNDSIFFASTIGNGFLIINRKTLKSDEFSTKNIFIADNIYAHYQIDTTLWLATENGLVALNIPSILRGKPIFNVINKTCGLPDTKIGNIINYKNLVYIFSDKWLTVLPTSGLNLISKTPKFYLKKTSVNDRTLLKNENLKHNENTVKIDFGFIAFNNQAIIIKYSINKNNKWIYTTDRELVFNSLAPGNYEIDVKYSIDNIHWAKALSLRFSIRMPWWKQWYFYLSLVVLLTTTGYFYFLVSLRNAKQKQYYLEVINDYQKKSIQLGIQATERERIRIVKELHDGVGSNLTAIKLWITHLLRKHNEQEASDVEDQFQVVIKEIRDIVYALTPAGLERYGLVASLKDFIDKLNYSNIDLNTFGTEINNVDLNLLVFRVIQELISNSIKHARASNITVHINYFDDIMNIVYEDNGMGFSYDTVKKGLGLDNIESRIQSVNGRLAFDSSEFGVLYTIDIPII